MTIAEAARTLAQAWTPWHGDKEAHAIFRAAVANLLDEALYPPPEATAPKPHSAEVMFGNDPQLAGERLAMMVTWRAT
jgi:hypothetical protein